MATDTRSGIVRSVPRDGRPSLPRLPRPQQTKDSSHPGNPCRRKRRLKKREFKSASVLTSGSNVTSPVERSINSASSVFPTSTPVDTPSSSKPSSRSNSIRSSASSKRGAGNVKNGDADRSGGEERDGVGDLLDFYPKYSEDYEQKKQRVLKGSFKTLLQNYFPDLIKTQKMILPSVLETSLGDDGYDTDLDPDLGFELLADERAKRCREDGVFAEYKHLCRRHKVVPNSFFMKHSTDEHLQIRHRYFSYGDSAALSHEIQNQPSVTSLDIEDNYMGPPGMLCFAEMLKSNSYITEANLANNNVGVYGARLMKFILSKNVRLVKLNMSGNKFGERGARYCAIAIDNNSTLREFNISNNSIQDEGACLIGKALANNTGLEVLDMSWNNISKKGAAGLSKGLKGNDRLLALKLRMNGCHDDGCRALIGALRYNDTLKELDIGANRIGDEGCKAVIKALPYLRLQILRVSMNPLGTDNAQNILKALLSLEEPPMKEVDFDGVVVEDDFQLLAEELAQRGCQVVYRIPPSSRERSRDLPLETLSHVMSFLDDVEMDPTMLFPDPGDGDLILTVQDLFTHMENSGMFRDKTRLFKLKQESQRDFRRRFLLRELMMVNTQRRQSMVDVMNSAQAVDNLDLTGSLEGLTTGRSSFSGDTLSN